MNKVKSLLGDLKRCWKAPPNGRYMSFREIASLSVGGIGVKFIVYCISQMIIAVGNTLIGNTIGIDPSALYVIYIISVLSGFPLTAVRAKMIDNTRSMKGKYRPYMQKNSVYYRAVKPYLDAKKTIAQSENYRHFETIEALYAPAKIRSAQKEAEQNAAAE